MKRLSRSEAFLATGSGEAELPVVSLPNMTVFPVMSYPIKVVNSRSLDAVAASRAGDQLLAVFKKRNFEADAPEISDLHRIGVAVEVEGADEDPGHGLKVIVKGLRRIRLLEQVHAEPYLRVRVEFLEDQGVDDIGILSLARELRQVVDEAVKSNRIRSGWRITEFLASNDNPSVLTDVVAANLELSSAEQQELLETLDVGERMQRVIRFTRAAAPLETESHLGAESRAQVMERALEEAKASYEGAVRADVESSPYSWVAILAGIVLVNLAAWGVAKLPIGHEGMLSLRDACATVVVGMSPASLLEHFSTGSYHSRCLPATQDCAEFTSKAGQQHHFGCPAGQCSMYWHRGDWVCRVDLGGGGRRALGPGKLLSE